MPSGLKNGAHNICPLRNQFQMLFVTNAVGLRCRNWMFEVGQEERVSRDSPKEETLFFYPIYTLSEFCGIFGLPIGVAPH